MAAPTQPIFGLIPTGSPIIINPTTAPSPTSFIYTLPRIAFSHIVVFLLPGITLPPNTAAAVYLSTTPQDASTFKFLGGIGPGKESAVFKVNDSGSGSGSGSSDMDTNIGAGGGSEITIGISVESADSVSAQMLSLQQSQTQSSSTDMVLANKSRTPISTADTVQLAQKIIKNAFNFLASFSGNVAAPSGGNGTAVEVVPLKAFEEWWRKFEGKVRNDPGFLQRGDGD